MMLRCFQFTLLLLERFLFLHSPYAVLLLFCCCCRHRRHHHRHHHHHHHLRRIIKGKGLTGEIEDEDVERRIKNRQNLTPVQFKVHREKERAKDTAETT